MDKMRADFEKAMRDMGLDWFSRIGDGYESETLDALWEGFKIGRESLVVELPHMADYVNMLGQVDKCYSYLDDLHAAIHAAGIRTK